MKMINLRYLGFFGFLGMLGLFTGNYGFFGFFGFFSFFAVTARPDERLTENTYKAGFYGFVISLLGLSTMITGLSMNISISLVSYIVAGTFIASIIGFVVSFIVLEKV